MERKDACSLLDRPDIATQNDFNLTDIEYKKLISTAEIMASCVGPGEVRVPQTTQERERFYLEFQPLVRRLVRQYGDTYDQREDLEGEIYCRFHILLEEYDPHRGIPLRAYIVRKLIIGIYTYARSQWRRQSHEISLDLKQETCGEIGADPRLTDPTLEWNDDLIKKELLATIKKAIGSLPQRQKQVVIGRYFEQRSFDEIAEVLGVCEATARSLLRHGINNLRRQIKRSRCAADF